MYLKRKEKTEYTGPEQYVADMIQAKNYRFIPNLCALSIKNAIVTEEDENNAKMVNHLYTKLLHLGDKTSSVEDNLQRLSARLDALDSPSQLKQESRTKVGSVKIEGVQKSAKDIETKLEKLSEAIGELTHTH